jgi:hypothetical protein
MVPRPAVIALHGKVIGIHGAIVQGSHKAVVQAGHLVIVNHKLTNVSHVAELLVLYNGVLALWDAELLAGL